MSTPEDQNWLLRITHDSARAIAAELDGQISYSTITRAAASDSPPAHVVVAVARAYGVHPVAALRDAGILTEEEAHPYTATTALRNVPSLIMLQELAHREAQRGQ